MPPIISLTEKLNALSLQEHLMGRIHFGINATASYLRIPQLVERTKATSSGIDLDIFLSSSNKIMDGLQNGTTDAGFIFGPVKKKNLTKRYICSTELVVAAPKKWEDKISRSEWKDIAKLPWIYSNSYCPFQQIIDDLFEQRNLEYNREICSDDEVIKSELVSSGIGISLLEKNEAERAHEDGRVCIWKTDAIHCALSFAYMAKRSKDPLIGALESNVLKVWELDKEA